MIITKKQIKKIVSKLVIKESTLKNNISINDKGHIEIDDHKYKIQADAGWAGTFDVKITECIPMNDGSLKISGDTSIKSVSQVMQKSKVDEIFSKIGEASFTVKGKIADFKFTKVW